MWLFTLIGAIDVFTFIADKLFSILKNKKNLCLFFINLLMAQIAITSWTPRGKNLGHGWSRRIYP